MSTLTEISEHISKNQKVLDGLEPILDDLYDSIRLIDTEEGKAAGNSLYLVIYNNLKRLSHYIGFRIEDVSRENMGDADPCKPEHMRYVIVTGVYKWRIVNSYQAISKIIEQDLHWLYHQHNF